MAIKLTSSETKLVEYSQRAIIKYNKIRHKKGGIDTLYSFLMSDSGAIHSGACFEPKISHATVCGERHAIANMVLKESYRARIESIVIADPVPRLQGHGTPPCGTCRELIWEFGTPKTSVILLQYIQGKTTWTFPRMEKYAIKAFYPHPYEPAEGLWEGYQPPYRRKKSE